MRDWGIFPSFLCIFSLHIEDNVQVRLEGRLKRKIKKYIVSFFSFSRIFFFINHICDLSSKNFLDDYSICDWWMSKPNLKKTNWFRILVYLFDLRRFAMWIKFDLTLKSSFSKWSFLFESWHILCTLDLRYKMKN